MPRQNLYFKTLFTVSVFIAFQTRWALQFKICRGCPEEQRGRGQVQLTLRPRRPPRWRGLQRDLPFWRLWNGNCAFWLKFCDTCVSVSKMFLWLSLSHYLIFMSKKYILISSIWVLNIQAVETIIPKLASLKSEINISCLTD